MSRPEHLAPPEIFYNEEEADKYASSSRMIEIQSRMSERAVELLLLPDRPCMILDVGCGSGISGDVLSEKGHTWVGVDISQAMLEVARNREVEGDIMLGDAGQGFGFRPGVFDGVISISAIQWLCNADRKGHEPFKRLCAFFKSLYNCLTRGGRAALQFYPETPSQVEMITAAAMRNGFGGGLVVDYPNSTRAKKYFLCLYAGFVSVPPQMPKALDGVPEDEAREATARSSGRERERVNRKAAKAASKVKGKDWVIQKKERHRRQGKVVKTDSKYTGRRRPARF
uniref:Methyltransferase type 11 domain-containing protein n=1 Tax=Chromera velia CCMP2878 TaxID=1169474 RepID=A0A0G4H443_9ALVE|mmetsp:Transcript_38387/g.75367  ORF Transcript_38387/g.75367 Transcript_38387/m.75367 type:complete len:284 (+) Transcript_38387:111-962(+)|eukprot:Cvel_24631.t1-p1 / transcript=Cvel_24631.t1 / gene=Cvel_24631 / organism=Chromera_velia_CCMP2878 / gene_product=Probable methyltransferase WBSCR22 homolog, putative / transcript_product=Probable methyltransferase WBSCR22 homolog, putative / location=Cvel_scaffold2687:19732-23602(-) / protein_length=283 / sequence_SO=supercontig / SO=protein_coding / is_pseudo=false